MSVSDSTAPAAAPLPVSGTVTPAHGAPAHGAPAGAAHQHMGQLFIQIAPSQPAAQPQAQPQTRPTAAHVRRARQGQWAPPQDRTPDGRPAAAPGSLWPAQQSWGGQQGWTSGARASRHSSNAAIWIGIAIVVIGLAGILANVGSSDTYQLPDTPYPVFGDTPFPTYEAPATPAPPAAFPLTDPLVATGAMNQARAEHTATLLPDGRVVIAGGLSTIRRASR